MTTPYNTTVPPKRPWLSLFSKFLVVCTLILIFMGGHVKSHEAGLSVPDWPGTWGYNMFTYPPALWTGGIFYEHTHRLFASFVGLCTVILMLWTLFTDNRGWVKFLSVAAFVAVVVQGILGGMTVLLHLPAWTSISHGVLAQTFFLLTILLAYTFSEEWRKRCSDNKQVQGNPVLKSAIMLTLVVYIQLILGALLRHTESGLALPDFPTMAGQWLPIFTQESVTWVNNQLNEISLEAGYLQVYEVTLSQIYIHFFHRLGALFVIAALFVVCRRAKQARDQYPQLWSTTVWLMGLITLQVILGISTVLTARTPLITSMHVVVGAAILGFTWFLTLRATSLAVFQESTVKEDASPSELSDATEA